MKAVLSALCLLSGPVLAQAADDGNLAPAEAYARDVTLMFFYHEMGHALIDVLDAPVLGQEEDAADMLAVLLIDRYWEPTWAEEKARVAADYWAESAPSWADENPGDVVTWDTHSPDERRYFNFVCLFYGGNPEVRQAFAADLELPDDRKETCAGEFDLMAQSWDRFLDQVAGSGQSLTFETKVDGYEAIATAISDEVAYMNERILLPKPLPVVLESCGEANSFYDPETVSITICTELIDEARDLAVLDHS